MCEICGTYNHQLQVNRTVDPTRTTTLRANFVRNLNGRFNELKRAIKTSIVDLDVFGLQPQTNQIMLPSREQFAFSRSQDKVAAFMDWIQRQVDAGLLEVTVGNQLGNGIDEAWTNLYIEDSYRRGVLRAQAEMRAAGYNVPGASEDLLQLSLNNPFHADRLGLLYTRTYSELKGITDQMDSMISRVLTQGMADGDNPRVIASKLLKVIDGLGPYDLTDTLGRFIPAKRRAEIMARTEIIRAHHQAMVQEYMNWAVEGVIVKAEFITAQDNRVCPDCQALEGDLFTLDKAMGLIPVHPQCRCIVLPVEVKK